MRILLFEASPFDCRQFLSDTGGRMHSHVTLLGGWLLSDWGVHDPKLQEEMAELSEADEADEAVVDV
eukprot:5721975-Amphidinium_carterae.1